MKKRLFLLACIVMIMCPRCSTTKIQTKEITTEKIYDILGYEDEHIKCTYLTKLLSKEKEKDKVTFFSTDKRSFVAIEIIEIENLDKKILKCGEAQELLKEICTTLSIFKESNIKSNELVESLLNIYDYESIDSTYNIELLNLEDNKMIFRIKVKEKEISTDVSEAIDDCYDSIKICKNYTSYINYANNLIENQPIIEEYKFDKITIEYDSNKLEINKDYNDIFFECKDYNGLYGYEGKVAIRKLDGHLIEDWVKEEKNIKNSLEIAITKNLLDDTEDEKISLYKDKKDNLYKFEIQRFEEVEKGKILFADKNYLLVASKVVGAYLTEDEKKVIEDCYNSVTYEYNKKNYESDIKNILGLDDVSNKKDTKSNSDTKDIPSVKYGKLLDVNKNGGADGKTLVIKVKIEPNLTNRLTIQQNYHNIEEIVKKRDGDKYNAIDYWAVADMTSGDESKVISFTVSKAMIDKIIDGKIYPPEYSNYLDDLWILPSLKD